jgi:hypothetical protein
MTDDMFMLYHNNYYRWSSLRAVRRLPMKFLNSKELSHDNF